MLDFYTPIVALVAAVLHVAVILMFWAVRLAGAALEAAFEAVSLLLSFAARYPVFAALTALAVLVVVVVL